MKTNQLMRVLGRSLAILQIQTEIRRVKPPLKPVGTGLWERHELIMLLFH